MRKAIVLIFILLSVFSFLPAKDVIVEGIGSNSSEAHEDALRSLSEYFGTKVDSETLLVTETEESSFYSNVSISSNSYLIGVEFESSLDDSGIYHEFASIGEDKIILYIQEIASTFNSLFPIDEKYSGTDDEQYIYWRDKAMRLDHLEKLISVYKMISEDWNLEGLPLDEKIGGESEISTIRGKYYIHLSERLQGNSMDILRLEKADVRRGLTEEEEAELEKARQEVNEFLELQKAEKRRQEEELMALRADLDNKGQEYIDRLLELGRRDDSSSNEWLDLIASIEDNRTLYQETLIGMNKELDSLLASYNVDILEIENNILNAPFEPDMDLDTEGNPRDIILEDRKLQFAKKKDSLKDEYVRASNQVASSASSFLHTLIDQIDHDARQLSKMNLSLSSSTGDIYTKVRYSIEDQAWLGNAYVAFGNTYLEIPFQIPYSSWTGKKAGSVDDGKGWREYEQEIEFWSELFRKSSSAYDVDIEFTIGCSSSEVGYNVCIGNVIVSNPFEDNRVVWNSGMPTYLDVLFSDNSEQLMYYIDNDLLVDTESVDRLFKWVSSSDIQREIDLKNARIAKKEAARNAWENSMVGHVYCLPVMLKSSIGIEIIGDKIGFITPELGLRIPIPVLISGDDAFVINTNLILKCSVMNPNRYDPHCCANGLGIGVDYTWACKRIMLFNVGLDFNASFFHSGTFDTQFSVGMGGMIMDFGFMYAEIYGDVIVPYQNDFPTIVMPGIKLGWFLSIHE